MMIKPSQEFLDLTEKLIPWKIKNSNGEFILKPDAPKEVVADFRRWKALRNKTFYNFA